MSESAYNSPLFARRLTESCCSSPARSIGQQTPEVLTDSDGDGDVVLQAETPGVPEQTVIAGWLKFRDNKKWKQRWGVITKLSPAADMEREIEYSDNQTPLGQWDFIVHENTCGGSVQVCKAIETPIAMLIILHILIAYLSN